MLNKLEIRKKVDLVDRGLGAEIFSGIVNGLGSIFALVALILVIVYAVNKGGKALVLCAVFYGVVLFLVNLFSCLYHSLAYNDGKRVFRVLTITLVHFLFTSCIAILTYKLIRDRFLVVTGISFGISMLSLMFNFINFEKFKYVRIFGFLLQVLVALYVAYFALALLPGIGFGLMLVAFIAFFASFVFHIFGYQLSYLNSVGHIILQVGNAFLFFAILLYVI